MSRATRRDSSCASLLLALGAVLGDPLLDRRRGLADRQQLPGQPLARRLGGRQRQMRGVADLGELLLRPARPSPRRIALAARRDQRGDALRDHRRDRLAGMARRLRRRRRGPGPAPRPARARSRATSCAAAPSASPTAAPSARNFSSASADAFAQRGEQRVERLALAGDARLALGGASRRRASAAACIASILPATASADAAVRSAWISIPAMAGGISSRSWRGDLGQRRAQLAGARRSARPTGPGPARSRAAAPARRRAARPSTR